jgi:hypothetical protein
MPFEIWVNLFRFKVPIAIQNAEQVNFVAKYVPGLLLEVVSCCPAMLPLGTATLLVF